MNINTIKNQANEELPEYTVLRGLISSFNFINIGVITKVHSENYVDVKLYYTNNTGKDIMFQAVRLLHIGTTKCKLIITPAVGDNVLLLCPKEFFETLEYNKKPTVRESMYLPYGNINMCGILIKDESDDNVKTTVTVDASGNIDVSTEGKINIDGDDNGGLCITPELVTQLGYLSNRVDTIINALKNSATGSQDGGATYKTNIVATLATITNTEDFSNVESETVFHGTGSE